jgi:DNA-binding transcriptional ArsR family regulator
MTDPAWEPADVRRVETAEEIKAMADPLRLRVLQLLMTTAERTWSVKEIAAELGQPVTKLYHHVKLLEAAALITDVESRLVSGILEHRYAASQRSLRFDDALMGSPETRPDSIAHVGLTVDTSRDDLLDYLNRDDADLSRVNVIRSNARLTLEETKQIEATIDEMVAGFKTAREAPDRADLPRTSMLFLMHPTAHDPA